MATITKTIERTVGRDFIRIHLELRDGGDPRGLSDGFSVTGLIWEGRKNASGASRARRGLHCDMGGCLHEAVLAAAPELAPVVAVHLASPQGVPMHAAANGWYFYSGDASAHRADRNPEGLSDHERAARALNIAPAELPAGMNEALFMAFVESLRPRWAQMAADARRVIDGLPS